jgi:hypothetical protein
MAAGSCQQQREPMPAACAAGRERQDGLTGRSSVRSLGRLADRSSCLWSTQVVIPTITTKTIKRIITKMIHDEAILYHALFIVSVF